MGPSCRKILNATATTPEIPSTWRISTDAQITVVILPVGEGASILIRILAMIYLGVDPDYSRAGAFASKVLTIECVCYGWSTDFLAGTRKGSLPVGQRRNRK